MKWSVDPYLERLYQKNIPQYSFKSGNHEEWGMWRKSLKDAFMNDLGEFPQKKVDLKPRIIERCEIDTYTRERIVFSSDEGLDVPAYLLIPKNKSNKMPAIVACHGHGYGSREIVGLNPDGSENTGDPGYQKNFAIELVKRGFIVIVPELLGFGDRRLKEDEDKELHESSCFRIATYLLMMGRTMPGMRVWDTMRTIDYLLTRGDVDPERIGCMGISGGGLVCSFAAALDERIRVSVVSGYVNTFKDSVMGMFHCVDNFIPGLVKHAEMPDIIGLIAPQPLLIEAGAKDPIFPIEAVREAYSKLGEIYEFLNVRDRLDIDIFEGDHQISGKKAYDWFEKWL